MLFVNLPVDSLNSSARGAKNRSAPDNREKNILAAPGISPLNLFHAAPTLMDALDDLRRSLVSLYRPNYFGIDVGTDFCIDFEQISVPKWLLKSALGRPFSIKRS